MYTSKSVAILSTNNANIERFLAAVVDHSPTTFHKNCLKTFSVILNRQTMAKTLPPLQRYLTKGKSKNNFRKHFCLNYY